MHPFRTWRDLYYWNLTEKINNNPIEGYELNLSGENYSDETIEWFVSTRINAFALRMWHKNILT